jgi:hypothetical protein
MDKNNVTRRRIIFTAAGAGASAFLCRHASAQTTWEKPPSAENAGDLHTELLEKVDHLLKGSSIISPEGLIALITEITQATEPPIFTIVQAKLLTDLVNKIFASDTPDALQKEIANTYNQIEQNSENILLAIVNIAQSSFNYTKELIRNNQDKLKNAVLSDIAGAIAPLLAPGKLSIKQRIASAIWGAASSSVLALFQGAESNKFS